jgi:uncharacterized protein YlxW (UPF0749 family)
MSLLTDLYRSTLDSEYSEAADRRRLVSATDDPDGSRDNGPAAAPQRQLLSRPVVVLGIGVLVIGMLLATTALQARRTAPALAAERLSLVERIESERGRTAALREDVDMAALGLGEVRDAALRATLEGERLSAELDTLSLLSGARPVSGPGLVVVVDDAVSADLPVEDNATPREGLVQDIDLQQLVNGLWEAGAEAVAVDGNRVTTLSSIRTAGDALFMDLHPLSAPYEVVAIGDPQALGPRFLDSYGAGWFQFLASAYDVRFDVSSVDEVEVPEVSGLDLDWAETYRRTDT